jgi:hypothetical protein
MSRIVDKPLQGRVSWRIYKSYNGKWMPVTQTKTELVAKRVFDSLKAGDHTRKYMLIKPMVATNG